MYYLPIVLNSQYGLFIPLIQNPNAPRPIFMPLLLNDQGPASSP
jgi:hypothetical protein